MTTFARKLAARLARGLSIVELMCCASIVATLVSSALPALTELGRRQRVQATAAQLQADIQLARTTAIQRGQPVRLSWQVMPGGGARYMLHSGAAGQCSCDAGPSATCRAGAQAFRVVALPPREAVTLNAASRSMLFDAHRGTVTPTATFKLGDGQGRARHLVVNILGRVCSCSPDNHWFGIKAC